MLRLEEPVGMEERPLCSLSGTASDCWGNNASLVRKNSNRLRCRVRSDAKRPREHGQPGETERKWNLLFRATWNVTASPWASGIVVVECLQQR